MAANNKVRPEVEQIDLTKLNLQQLQQLKTEFESVCVTPDGVHMINFPFYGVSYNNKRKWRETHYAIRQGALIAVFCLTICLIHAM